jgi:CRISPR-associated protein (TIGR02710 family)
MSQRPPALSAPLASLSQRELSAEQARRYDELRQCGRADVRQCYRDKIVPVERESLWRNRAGQPFELLFITVGAQSDTPIHVGLGVPAHKTLLLHTDVESTNGGTRVVDEVCEALGLVPGRDTVSIGDGKDASTIYRKMRGAWHKAGAPARLAVDLTGGFKVMSAAAGAVSFVLPGCTLTYLDTTQRKIEGQPVWLDSRMLSLDNPYEVFGTFERRRAQTLWDAGRFEAAAPVWAAAAERSAARTDELRSQLASAYASIERIDLREAAEALEKLVVSIRRLRRTHDAVDKDTLATPAAHQALTALATGARAVASVAGKQCPTSDSERIASSGYLDFIAMLLQMAVRRQHLGQYDLAALYAYRAIEAIPQRRLVARGFEVARMDWTRLWDKAERPGVRAHLEKKYGELRPKVDRGMGFEILASAFDDIVAPGELSKLHGIGESRNRSVLAHGLARVDSVGSSRLIETARDLLDRLLAREGTTPATLEERHRFWIPEASAP